MAVTLTLEQKQALKTAILNTPALVAFVTSQSPLVVDTQGLTDALNAPSTKVVWKTRLLKHELTDDVGPTGTTFDWGTQAGNFIARTQGERDCWTELWNTALACNPSNARVRDAFNNIFSGSGAGAVNNRAHILAMSKRVANVLEAVFATGTGTDATPGLLVVEGTVRAQDINTILTS